MGRCWRNVAEKMEEEVLDKYKVENGKKKKKMLSEVGVLFWNGEGCAKARNT